MDYAEKISELRSVSEVIDSYISNGTYLLKYESTDSITDQSVLNDCYVVIIEELQRMGVLPTVEISELISDYYTADGAVVLRNILDQDNLKELILSKLESSVEFQEIFDSTIIDETDYLQYFIETARKHFPQKETSVFEPIGRVEHLFFSNIMFKRHVTSILANTVPKSTMSEVTKDIRQKYLWKISLGRDFFKTAIKFLPKEIKDSLDMEYLDHAIRLYDIEKITGSTVDLLCWAVMTDPESLHEDLRKKQDATILSHKSTTPHHIEYFQATRKVPSREQLVELTAHHVEPGCTEEEFWVSVNEMLSVMYPVHFKDEIPQKVINDEAALFVKLIADEMMKSYMGKVHSKYMTMWDILKSAAKNPEEGYDYNKLRKEQEEADAALAQS